MKRLPPTPPDPALSGGGLRHGLTAGRDTAGEPVEVDLTGVTETHEARW